MLVVKLGGSLYGSQYLSQWLHQLAQLKTQKVVIVPGGGPFADCVRDADQAHHLSNENAHAMAVLAMQQYALLLSNINSSYIRISNLKTLASHSDGHYIWLPYESVMQSCHLPCSWKVTSDSLAAWLAHECKASHLCLVKSHDINEHIYNSEHHASIVDEYFSQMIQQYSGKISIYHASQVEKMTKVHSYE
jgi:aspartokinase-like uncharacterized kinase